VLLSVGAGAWKITDFGLTFEGTSRVRYTTRNSRGTEGYRAVEVLGIKEVAFVTKASDIWALGCILHELAFRKKLFPRDYNVWDYASTQELKELQCLEVNQLTATCIRELIHRTVDLDWWKRPTASDVLQLLDTLTNPGILGMTVYYVGEPESESSPRPSDASSRVVPSSPPVIQDRGMMLNVEPTSEDLSFPLPESKRTGMDVYANDDPHWENTYWRSCCKRCGVLIDGQYIEPQSNHDKITYECGCPHQATQDIVWVFVPQSEIDVINLENQERRATMAMQSALAASEEIPNGFHKMAQVVWKFASRLSETDIANNLDAK